ncbi:MAG: hypothetical protein DHS20C02_15860 [Micavibrio sp.]|nr:MAG: hypothetical protein DHS20C02_15860 [Micavibrio sp.]
MKNQQRHQTKHEPPGDRPGESGNLLFMILIAVVLIGALTAAIQSTGRPEGANIDKETLVIRASEVQRYASELERAVLFIVQQNGRSEVDIRFGHASAHADYGLITDEPNRQVFHRDGGAAKYRAPPADIQTPTGGDWEFYAGTHLPQVGSTKADLVAVLPNVTQGFCEKINELNQQDAAQPEDAGAVAAAGNDPGSCVDVGALGRFDAARQYYDAPSTPNTVDEGTYTTMPGTQGCVQCVDMGGAPYHFYHVLYAR